jgi:hypothetical protein
MPVVNASAGEARLEHPASNALEAGDEQLIYRAVYYFNLFDYPVRPAELANYCGVSVAAAKAALAESESAGWLGQRGGYAFIPNRDWIITSREKDEAFFAQHYKKIRRAAWWLSHLPFVRGLLLTGRTAKGLLSGSDDFDYLVVVAKGRARLVWLLIVLLRRLVSLNYRNANFKWFCCNYILAEDELALKEQDIFLALELTCAFPVLNRPLYERFLQANEWRHEYFQKRGHPLPPNLALRAGSGRFQALLEIPCNLLWSGFVRRFVDDFYRRRWLKLGMVKDEKDYGAKASDAYVKPDTGGRRKFIVERAGRADPLEHNSFFRTKINLHAALRAKTDVPDILFASPAASQSAESAVVAAAEFLSLHGYRAEIYNASTGSSAVELFRLVKARLIPLVALHAVEPERSKIFRMIELFHGVGARVIICGPDAERRPQQYLQAQADIVITGEWEQKMFALLEHIKKGSIALEAIEGILFPGKDGITR